MGTLAGQRSDGMDLRSPSASDEPCEGGPILKNDQERADQCIAFNSVGEQYAQHMAGLAEKLAAMFPPLQDQLSATAAAMFSSVQPYSDKLSKINWPKLQVRMQQSCERLANLGWTLPMRFTPYEMMELVKYSESDQDIEQYMMDYYTSEGGRSFLELRTDILSSANLVCWRNHLEQCFDVYDREQYLILIPALLTVIEGAIAQKAGRLKSKSVKTMAHASEVENAKDPRSVNFLVWHSIRLVLEKLFADSDFGGPHPGEINRHWILHGRDHTQWTRMDAIRLFNLLATIK